MPGRRKRGGEGAVLEVPPLPATPLQEEIIPAASEPPLIPTPVPTPVIDVVVTPEPLPSASPPEVTEHPKPNGRKSPPRRTKKTESATVLPVEVPPPIEKPPALADLVKELRSVMEECGGVREQLKAIRKDFQEVTEELARIRNRSQEARKELQDAESALHELRRSVETFTSLPQDVQNTAGELGHVRKRTGEIRKELVEAEKPLVELRNTLLRIGEEQQNQSKVLQTRFHTLEGECRDVEKQLGEVRGQVGNLRSAVHDGREEARISREAIREDAQDLQAQLDELREQVEVIRGQVVATGLQARIVEQVENKQLEQALSEPRLQIDEVVEREPIESAARSAAPKRHLGVTVDPSAKVLAVIPDTPAEKAGLRPGDVIVNINGKPITNSEDLRLAVEQSRSDEEVELIVARGVETHEFDVGLSEASVPETPA